MKKAVKKSAKKVAVKKAPVKKAKKAAKKVVAKKAVKKVAVKKAASKKIGKIVVPVVKVKKPSTVVASVPTVMAIATKKKINKIQKPAVVQTSFGLGLMYMNEPKVSIKHRMYSVEKTIVHLVKDNMEPRTMNGKPKKVLVDMKNVTIITPAVEEKIERTPRAKRENGEPSNKDFSKYKFAGNVLSKGRLIHAVISKFAADNNPTLIELNAAFPNATIRAYGKGLFVSIEDAERINTESKRTRFFTKKEDVIKIKGAKIAVSNQIDGELVKRFLPIAISLGFKITTENVPAPVVASNFGASNFNVTTLLPAAV